MDSILEVKKGKVNLTADKNVFDHNQGEITNEPIPEIKPLYDGHELKINQKLITNGLATISVRNLRSNKFAIKKRNSFFNLHRPELKGLSIVPAENQQEKVLQQLILKEMKTISELRSTKSLCKITGLHGTHSSIANHLRKTPENGDESEEAAMVEKNVRASVKTLGRPNEIRTPSEDRVVSSESAEPFRTSDVISSAFDSELKSTVIE